VRRGIGSESWECDGNELFARGETIKRIYLGSNIVYFDKMIDMWICQCMAMYYRPPPSSSMTMTILRMMVSSHHMSNHSLVRQAMSGDGCVKEEGWYVYTYDF
jgi:hypothetical protein